MTHGLVPLSGVPSVVMDMSTGVINPPSVVAERLYGLYHLIDQNERYFTLAYGVLDAATGVLRHVSVGHPGPVLIRNQEARRIDNENFPIGMLSNSCTARVRSNCSLVIASTCTPDGIAHESDPKGELLGQQRLHAELIAARTLPLSRSIDNLFDAVVSWRGKNTLSDDVSMLAIERLCPE